MNIVRNHPAVKISGPSSTSAGAAWKFLPGRDERGVFWYGMRHRELFSMVPIAE